MDPITIITTISAVIMAAQKAEQTIEAVTPFAEQLFGMIDGSRVTAAQLDQIMQNVHSISSQLQAPLPPDEDTVA